MFAQLMPQKLVYKEPGAESKSKLPSEAVQDWLKEAWTTVSDFFVSLSPEQIAIGVLGLLTLYLLLRIRFLKWKNQKLRDAASQPAAEPDVKTGGIEGDLMKMVRETHFNTLSTMKEILENTAKLSPQVAIDCLKSFSDRNIAVLGDTAKAMVAYAQEADERNSQTIKDIVELLRGENDE